MKYLFIDTSLSDVSIAIIEDDKILASINKNIPNEHSIYTNYYIDELLKQSNLKPKDIDKILVVVGPGSFTGIRIGVTIAKVYGYMLNKEVIEVSSLKARILGKKDSYYLSMIDAKNNNYYVGLYDDKYDEIEPESFKNKEEIDKLIAKYHPKLLTENDKYDLKEIINYYKDKPSTNIHLLKPNYLKLPQAIIDKK